MKYEPDALRQQIGNGRFFNAAGEQKFDPARTIITLVADKPLDGFEREVMSEASERLGSAHQFGATNCIPWPALIPHRRDLSLAAPGAGAALSGDLELAAAVALQPYSVAARAGFQIQEGLALEGAVPGVSDEITGTWLTGATDEVTPETPVIGMATMRPHTWAGTVKFSGRLMRQMKPGQARAFVRERLMRAVGRAIDEAALIGRNTVPVPINMAQPVGFTATPGVAAYTHDLGAGLVGVLAEAQRYVCMRISADDKAAWIIGPTLRENLAITSTGRESTFVGGKILDRTTHCTAAMTTFSAGYGDWSLATLGLFGSGVEIQVDPFSDFKSDVIAMRVLVSLDVAFSTPSAFALVA